MAHSRNFLIILTALLNLSGCALLSGDRPDPPAVRTHTNLTTGLDPANVRPFNQANKKVGGGSATMLYSHQTQEFFWTIHFPFLAGVKTIGFYGPASTAEIGVLQISVPFGAESPATGKAQLTPAQGEDLVAGRWYISIQTEQFPAGDVRGQIREGGSIGGNN